MKFLMGEGVWSQLERALYKGGIGLFYDTAWGGILTYITAAVICILAVIGLITVLKFFFSFLFGRKGKKKMSASEKWMKTGKF